MTSSTVRLVRKLGCNHRALTRSVTTRSRISRLTAATAPSLPTSLSSKSVIPHYNSNTAASVSGVRWLTSAQPSDDDDNTTNAGATGPAATALNLLASTPFVRREDQKMEEQMRRRLSDVSLCV